MNSLSDAITHNKFSAAACLLIRSLGQFSKLNLFSHSKTEISWEVVSFRDSVRVSTINDISLTA